MFALSEFKEGIGKSRLQGSALALAPNSLKELEAGLTAQSYDALDRTLKDRDLAPVWLAKNFWEFRQLPAVKAFLSDLPSEAQHAVAWLAICNLGGGCEEGGLTRLDACLTSQLCAGGSVEESVAHVLGADNMPQLTARANQLGFSILANGAVFFIPK